MRLAAVLGGARGGFDELASLPPVPVFAVNDAAAEYPGQLEAFVTLHPEKLPMWLGKRRAAGLPEPGAIIAHTLPPHEAPGVGREHVTELLDYRWPDMTGSGSSGLFAVKVALARGYRVVLCGVPMDPQRTHYEQSTFRNDHSGFCEAWSIALPYLRDNVRSMSGWTAELLGKPDSNWLGN